MLAGKKAFEGESVSDTLASVLKLDPDWDALPSETPALICKLIPRCLTKDRKQRLQAIGGARIVLENPAGEETTAAAPSSAALRARFAIAIAVVMTVTSAWLGWIAWSATRTVERPVLQFNAELGQDVTPVPSGAWGPQVVLSPDGSLLAAIIQGADGQRHLGTRGMDQSRMTLLPGTQGAFAPFFSPDGKWIAYSAPDGLKKISSQGSVPVKICDACVGGSWGDDNSIVTMPGVGTGIGRISSDGGTPALVSHLDASRQEYAHRWPQMLPGSQAVLFTAYSYGRDYDDAEIDLVHLKSGKRKVIYKGGFNARYLRSGHLLFIHQNTLFAAAFDIQRLEVTGAPQPVLDGIRNGADGGADFDFSQNGTLVYLSNEGTPRRSIFRFDSAGTQPLEATPGLYAEPHFSPDGKHLTYSLDDGQGHTDIWVRDLERNNTRRLTTLPGRNLDPVWTPDSAAIIFISSNPAAPGLYWMRSDGSTEPQHLTTAPERLNRPSAVSPDGKWLACLRPAEAGAEGGAIWMVPVEGDPGHPKLGNAELFMNSAIFPAFSPDGRWVAYYRQLVGQQGVWVRPLRGPGGPWLVDSDAGSPVWSRNGHELFYVRTSSGQMMAASYSVNGDSFVADKPRRWSEKRLLPGLVPVIPTYDVAPDGKGFAVVLYEDGTAQEKPITHVTFLLNFFDDLRRKVPVK
jgi:serine/threonine-protein kinase